MCILIPICVFCCKSKQKKKKGHSASIPEKNSIKYTAHTKFIAFNNLPGILCVTPPPPDLYSSADNSFTSWNFFMKLLNIPKLCTNNYLYAKYFVYLSTNVIALMSCYGVNYSSFSISGAGKVLGENSATTFE